jgi:hypothetical protein
MGLEVIAGPFLVGLGGVVACVVMQMVHGRSSPTSRVLIAAGLAALDLLLWAGLVFLSFLAASVAGLQTNDARAIPLFLAIGVWPWILPAVLFFRARRARA